MPDDKKDKKDKKPKIASIGINSVPGSTDGDDAWLNWYDTMRKSPLGTRKANELFKYAWQKMKPTTANTSELRLEMERHGVQINTDNPFGQVKDLAVSFVDDITSVGKWVFIGGSLIIVFGVVAIGVGIMRGSIKAIIPVP